MTQFQRILLLTFTLLHCLSGFNGEAKPQTTLQTDYSLLIKQTEKKVNQITRKHHLPAVAITLVDNQEIVYEKAFGLINIESKIPASTESVFKLWSVAKPFTAIEIFREIEEGLIDLDLPISKYLPEFSIKNRYAEQKPITIRNILAHRSGLPRNECVSVSDTSCDHDFLEKFEKSTLDCYTCFPVETRYKYSNLGYDILGRIIEQSRHQSFIDYMDENILKTIGMDNSSFSFMNLPNPENLAKGYGFYNGEYFPIDQSEDISSVPSGNLYSTIEDLSLFLKAVFKNSVLFQNRETMPLMFEDQYSTKSDPETMGLGWKTSKMPGGELLIWHDGGPDDGTGALIAFLPERKLGLAIVSNSTGFGAGNVSVPLALKILQQMLEIKFDINSKAVARQERKQPDKQLLKNYEGKYVVFGRIMEVNARNNKLKWKISGIGLDLIPVSESEFKITHWMDKIGLTKIFKPPFDLSKIKVEFLTGKTSDSCTMIINFANISYEMCPRYPVINEIPEIWKALAGEYRMAKRLPQNKAGNYTGSRFSISVDEDVLVMSYPFGPVFPVGKDHIIIAGGPFAGETMEYYSESGNIIHQNAVFVPVNRK